MVQSNVTWTHPDSTRDTKYVLSSTSIQPRCHVHKTYSPRVYSHHHGLLTNESYFNLIGHFLDNFFLRLVCFPLNHVMDDQFLELSLFVLTHSRLRDCVPSRPFDCRMNNHFIELSLYVFTHSRLCNPSSHSRRRTTTF